MGLLGTHWLKGGGSSLLARGRVGAVPPPIAIIAGTRLLFNRNVLYHFKVFFLLTSSQSNALHFNTLLLGSYRVAIIMLKHNVLAHKLNFLSFS